MIKGRAQYNVGIEYLYLADMGLDRPRANIAAIPRIYIMSVVTRSALGLCHIQYI